ncbi:protein of unknown function DUF442 [Gloeothece citriformis PCC 7424]|uniref:Beta-lactamase hydrolase-family protein n=1 Tax=Gloeothece citriformis (strain PCC 7424) TaxID=65393 RepID=B7K931_GLOC7|nr:protein tyrosine phosphatase family protein [Gloeothece citriformis]ACK72800.1 protein of unknown function DUF442 [Gloeothece citriformis PCC 7424]
MNDVSDLLQEIKNYYWVNQYLATSGQPTPEQFKIIQDAGYDVVINLALPTSDYAIVNEGAIVTGLGMVYVHIPVVWEAPKLEDIRLFFGVMESLSGRKVWVHCALNMRVSCFVYLYQKLKLNLPEEQASYPMSEIWQPNEVWTQFIEDVKGALSAIA